MNSSDLPEVTKAVDRIHIKLTIFTVVNPFNNDVLVFENIRNRLIGHLHKVIVVYNENG